jgi:hypothetical protein
VGAGAWPGASIAELRAHAHEAVDEALNWVEYMQEEQAAERTAAANKVVKFPARHEEAPPL